MCVVTCLVGNLFCLKQFLCQIFTYVLIHAFYSSLQEKDLSRGKLMLCNQRFGFKISRKCCSVTGNSLCFSGDLKQWIVHLILCFVEILLPKFLFSITGHLWPLKSAHFFYTEDFTTKKVRTFFVVDHNLSPWLLEFYLSAFLTIRFRFWSFWNFWFLCCTQWRVFLLSSQCLKILAFLKSCLPVFLLCNI